MKRVQIVITGAFLALGACIQTQEMQIAPNVVRLDTDAEGRMWVGKTGNATLVRAAQLTIAHGYTHFKLADVQTGQGSQYAGTYTNVSAPSPYYASAFSTPIIVHTSHVGATVIMLHASEPGAFDAAQVLRENQSQ